MLSLVWKDFVVARWFLLAGLPLYAVKLLGFAVVPPAYLTVTFLITALLAYGSIAIEEMQSTESLWCSLPVSRRDVVLARYSTTVIGAILGLGISWAVGRVAFAWLSSHTRPLDVGIGSYAALFFLLSLGAALYLPCYFRLGAGRGLLAFSWISLALVVGSTVAGSAIAAVAGSGDILADPTHLDPELVAAIETWLERWSTAISILLTAVALMVTTASAALSVRFYAQRDC